MSSNIQIQRICQFCGNEFIARTTVTKYCGAMCSKRAYKARIKLFKIEDSNTQTFQLKNLPNERLIEIGAKEYLNIEESCLLLSVSRWTLWRMIKNGRIAAKKLGRLIRIKRSDIDDFFKNPDQIEQKNINPNPLPNTKIKVERFDCYSLDEIRRKYNISDKALYELIKRNNLEKLRIGKFIYIPKAEIEKHLGLVHTLFD